MYSGEYDVCDVTLSERSHVYMWIATMHLREFKDNKTAAMVRYDWSGKQA